jgi:hypothetical protein
MWYADVFEIYLHIKFRTPRPNDSLVKAIKPKLKENLRSVILFFILHYTENLPISSLRKICKDYWSNLLPQLLQNFSSGHRIRWRYSRSQLIWENVRHADITDFRRLKYYDGEMVCCGMIFIQSFVKMSPEMGGTQMDTHTLVDIVGIL